MSRNRILRQLAFEWPRPIGNLFLRFLKPSTETHDSLFGKYKFNMDLSMGFLQRYLFLFSDSYEVEVQRTLRQMLRPGMVVLDIGANVGFFTLLMADLVGPHGSVHSFEPHPSNIDLLGQNVRSNNLSQVGVYPFALADKKGTAVLSVNPINDGGHSLGDMANNPDLAGWDSAALKVEVETDTLDHFLNEHDIKRVDLIKMDVEGAENLVLSGASGVLSGSHPPMIILEVGEVAQAYFGKTERELREMLYVHEYSGYIMGDGLIPHDPDAPVEGMINMFFQKKKPPSPSD